MGLHAKLFDRPMRWAQLTLVENDPGRFDPAFWLDYFRRIHADGAVLSTGGYVAYHPTRIADHHVSRWLGDSDPFGDLVRGCRAMGMAVIARTDPHAVHDDVKVAHPEWIHVRADGTPWPHWATPGAWVTCALGPYNFEHMTRIHREIVELYGVDGIFANRWAGHGVCYCEHCRRTFADATGLPIPVGGDPTDAPNKAYAAWRQERLFALCRVWNEAIKIVRPEASYIPNSGGGSTSSLDMRRLGELVPILFADRQGREGLAPPWVNGKTAKEFRGALGHKPIGGIFSVGHEVPHRWKDSVQSRAEIEIWAAEGIAHGMRPWFTKFSGTLHDRRWLDVVEGIFTRHHRAERYLRNTNNLARVALVYSQRSGASYRGPEGLESSPEAWVEAPILGAYQALLEARIPFEMIHESRLSAEHVAPFKTLVLANTAALSDDACEQIRAFVRGGGGVVATFETSRYDEHGRKRPELGLADLFGVRVTGNVEGPLRNTYLRLHPGPGTEPLLSELSGAERIIGGVHRLPVDSIGPLLYTPVTRVAPYPDLPMEEVYPRDDGTAHPELFLREIGPGKVAYFPWDIDRTFWDILDRDHGRLLAGAVLWATSEPSPVTVRGPGLIDVAVWEQACSLAVHLVNLTNPMTMRGSYREHCPVGPLDVELALPEGAAVGGVSLLTAGGPVPYEIDGGRLRVTVPRVACHEIVAIDLQAPI
jgi:hypothetical protein